MAIRLPAVLRRRQAPSAPGAAGGLVRLTASEAGPLASAALPLPPPTWCGPIPRDVAMSVPAVRRGVATISGVIASLPLRRWRDGQELPPGPLLSQPEHWCPYVTTLSGTVRDLVLYPYAWWRVVTREWTGFPSKVERLDPAWVQVQTVPGTEGTPERTDAFYRGNRVPPGDLIRFDGPDLGLLTYGAETILTALRLERSADTYATPEVPTGVLTGTGDYALTDQEIRDLLARWRQARAEGSTAYLQGASYQVLQSTPEQLQMVQSREEAALQIARHLGLPPRYVGASSGDSMTYSTVTEERRDLLDISLAPYLGAIEQRLSMSDRNGSPIGHQVRFDATGFLRGSPEARAARAQTLIPLGVMTPDEARAAEPDLSGPAPDAPPVPAAVEVPA